MLRDLKEFKLPEIEEQVLTFWKQHSIFAQSLAKNKGHKKFVFFEGPPTANGMPGIHHQLARSFKDIVPRFKAMQGFDVPRKGGWDTHGLPVELQAEKELGFAGKQDIEKYGIAEFNKKCKELVWRYRTEFEHATNRLGFWLDLENPYVTYENNYIESLWNIVAQVDKRKLLYQGNKIVPWCTRCGTALSSHELAQGYKEVEDTSVYVKFRLRTKNKELRTKNPALLSVLSSELPVYILSWTTTPWTLPGNVALAVGEKIEYSVVKVGEEVYIIASERLSAIFPDSSQCSVLSALPGKDLLGLEYEPLFNVKSLKSKKSYKVYGADFVTTTDGTGVVHTAVMYGEDDYKLGAELGLPQHHTVDEQGHFTKEVKELAGMYAKSGKAEKVILDLLTARNLLLRTLPYKHEYPHCWRCNTALLYYARTSWFIGMSKLRKELIAANETVHWTPAHIKQGRFGEWLKEVKDWNFSRERYWGTPLPVWRSKDGKAQLVVSSLADIKKYRSGNGNSYWGIRHGEGTHNLEGKLASGSEKVLRAELTPKGIKQVETAAKKLKKQKIQVIVCSPYYRAQQTAKIIAKATKAKIITDKRLGEVDAGILNWQSISAYFKFFKDPANWFNRAPENGESHADVRRRVVACMKDIDKKFKNKRVLFVSHGDPLKILQATMRGLSDAEFRTQAIDLAPAELFAIDPPALPFDEDGRVDLHRPYIDQVMLRDPKSKKELYRVKEVCDVWFDSGAMPYAQYGYPQQTKQIAYPADYICEGMDQTRGWFYTLLAVATLLKRPAPYKNVICTGLIHDKNGLKMSKSKGNIVDPMKVMNTFGADILRWYFYTINDPGDAKNFDEADLGKITRRFVMILYNSYVFYAGYGKAGETKDAYASKNVLDQWVLSRLHEVTHETTRLLESYDIGKAALTIEGFTDDLSRWYIRRSRDRFQSAARGSGNEQDFVAASATLHEVLLTVSKLLAPFMPFFSEALYQSMGGGEQSVHLDEWPVAQTTVINTKLNEKMAAVRELAARALALRAEAGIKVRQPLATLFVANKAVAEDEGLANILKDEVNVQAIVFEKELTKENPAKLDTVITPQLREEGVMREFVRTVQGLRADAGFKMSDEIALSIVAAQECTDMFQRHSVTFKKTVGAKTLEFVKDDKAQAFLDTKVGEWPVWIGVRKM
jgi:isoleucyl-tRNA synthetase